MLYFRILALLILQYLFASSALALTIKVVDQYGQPLSGAVVEYSQITASQPALAQRPTAIMDQIDKQFSPEFIIIKKGDLVSFPNSDDIRHHVYSFSTAKTFELKLYKGRHEEPLKFEQPGVVVLGCNIHDSMVGYIYIAEQQAGKTNSQGEVNVTQIDPQTITIWHPNQKIELQNKSLFKINNSKSVWQLQIEVMDPAPRNTFAEKFKANAPTSP